MTLDFNIHSIGYVQEGGEVNNQNKTITENGVYTADSGYTGLGRVTVDVESTQPILSSLTITPSTTEQTFVPDVDIDGYNTVKINAVTANIDEDIIAENIKKDVEILGVTGTYEGGGGSSQTVRGSWVVPQAVLDLEDAFDNFNVSANGLRFLYGFMFHDGVKNISFNTRQNSQFLTSDDNGVPRIATKGTNETVTFNNDKNNWIILESNIDISSASAVVYIEGSTNVWTITLAYKYLVIKDTKNITSSFSSDSLLDKYNRIESFKSYNVKIPSFPYNAFKAKLKYFPPITNWDSAKAPSYITSYMSNLVFPPNIPYGMDFSDITTNMTLNEQYPNLKEAYIILPKADFKFWVGVTFTKDNWQYIADNAPTVSGKTLTMGSLNINICGGASGTIISTLTSKGWTVN